MEECEELAEALEKQKKAFQQIVDEKQKLISKLTDDIEKKDEDYLKMLKQQKVDISTIIEAMHDQYYNMRRIYLHELEEIEEEFKRERRAILDTNKNDIDSWIKKHNDSEQKFIENRDKTEKENAREIEKLRVKDDKSYASLKKNIETDIQNLQ